MSIRVKKWEPDLNGEVFYSLSNPDCGKSFTMHHNKRMEEIATDFRGRVEDEIAC